MVTRTTGKRSVATTNDTPETKSAQSLASSNREINAKQEDQSVKGIIFKCFPKNFFEVLLGIATLVGLAAFIFNQNWLAFVVIFGVVAIACGVLKAKDFIVMLKELRQLKGP